MSLRPSLQRIALSLAVAWPCIVAGMCGAEAQHAPSKAAASKRTPAASETDRVLDAAAKAIDAGNADAAMAPLEKVLSGGGLSNSHMARALFLRGLAHRQKGRTAQAMADFSSAVWLKDGLSERDRTAALNARSEAARDAGVAAPAVGGDSSGAAAAVTSPGAAPETPVRTGAAGRPRYIADGLSEAGFPRASRPAAPVNPQVNPLASPSAGAAPSSPSTSSWQSATTVEAPERQRSAAPPRQQSATETPPSGSGIGSFFSGLFSGLPSASGDAGGGAQTSPRTERWATTARPAEVAKAGRPEAPLTTSAVPRGDYRLQITTVRSRKEADAVATRVRAEHGRAIGRRQIAIDQRAFGGMGTFYRVLLGPYAETDTPTALCNQLRPKGYDCLVVTN